MATAPKFVAKGVIPATLIAFDQDYATDQKNSIKHLHAAAATDRLSAITVNGHASEIQACSFAEQQELLALSLADVGDRLQPVNGVYADGSLLISSLITMGSCRLKCCLAPHAIIV